MGVGVGCGGGSRCVRLERKSRSVVKESGELKMTQVNENKGEDVDKIFAGNFSRFR